MPECTNAPVRRGQRVHSCIPACLRWRAPLRPARRSPTISENPSPRSGSCSTAATRPSPRSCSSWKRAPGTRCRCSRFARASRTSSAWDASTMCASMRALKAPASRCDTSSAPFTSSRKSSSRATSRRPASTSAISGARSSIGSVRRPRLAGPISWRSRLATPCASAGIDIRKSARGSTSIRGRTTPRSCSASIPDRARPSGRSPSSARR